MIKVIIVDDCQNKISNILNSFPDREKVDVSIASCSASAQRLFSEKAFDLAIVDLALPNRESEEPRDNVGLELIQSVNEFDWFKKPRNTIAITQHSSLNEEYKDQLRELGVTLHYYDTSKSLDQVIKYQVELAGKYNNQADFLYDLVIITALDEEAEPIVNSEEFSWYTQNHFGITDLNIKTCKYLSAEKEYILGLIVLPKMGLVSSSITTSRIVNFLRPRCIVMPGICAGVKSEVSIGDVIVANPSWEWQTGKWKGDEFAIEPYQLSVDQGLIRHIEELNNDGVLEKIWKNTSQKRPDSPPKQYIGPVVSGSSVISNQNMIDELRSQHRKLLGLEMEIFGVYAASQQSHIKPKFIGFKSVCDFGDEAKGDNYHLYCSEISGKYCVNFVKKILPSVRDNK